MQESQNTIATLQFGPQLIDPNGSTFIIAETGTTCLGDLNKAIQLIDVCARAGVDAVKFQLIDPTQVSDSTDTYPVKIDGVVTQVNMKEMFSKLQYSKNEWQKISDYCQEKGMIFFATVDFSEGVDLLEGLSVPCHKLGAWDATYKPLIQKIGSTGKPMMIDLGPPSEKEIENLKKWYLEAGGSAIIFLHDFHTENDVEMNMRAITYLNKTQPWPVGYSSPAHDHDLDFLAMGLGASVIEKRLTLDRTEVAFHAHECLEPDEFITWVERIRHLDRALGKECIAPTTNDLAGSHKFYRSICALTDIKKGEVFSPENLGGKRPGTGVPTERLEMAWGMIARRDIAIDELLTLEDVSQISC